MPDSPDEASEPGSGVVTLPCDAQATLVVTTEAAAPETPEEPTVTSVSRTGMKA